ncbi:YqaA family protein [Rhizobium oryzicola]|uniref:YqaA family protein n=1 Tax=Rhizobium oryzicola TaxID=1232668 RepID=A0ABT8SZA8_9HYPH|nr:YqaA family protein [Rhizobium oryzicola]MDO1582967.1 YqaA family protein [Rhizobium oryzicola]
MVAFIAATILPAQSEAVLVGLLLTGGHSAVGLVAVAALGNTLGSVVNWFLGAAIERYRDRRWFPVSPKRLQQAQAWYQRYGKWSLLVSWLPVIGDAITVTAGVMREPLPIFIVLVALAKTARYVVLAVVTLGLI